MFTSLLEAVKPVEVDLEPTLRARVESGTFVRGSGQRSSWRLLPSVTQQVKEAMAAEKSESEVQSSSKEDGDKRQPEEAQTEQETEEMSFLSEDLIGAPESGVEGQKALKSVVLVAHDIEDEEGAVSESVTMTFTIGSRGNQQPSAGNGDLTTAAGDTSGGKSTEGHGHSTQEQNTVWDAVDSSQDIVNPTPLQEND